MERLDDFRVNAEIQKVGLSLFPPADPRQLAADTARAKRISELYDRCLSARRAVQLIKQRNKRSLEAVEADYAAAADALARLITGAETRGQS